MTGEAKTKSAEPVYEYMPEQHVEAFLRAAKTFRCWILVRKGNKEAKQWIGRFGYVPKLLDCKAKTADLDFGRWKCAGLVACPEQEYVPQAFSPERIGKAKEEWEHFKDKLYKVDPQDPAKSLHEADKAGKHYTLQSDKNTEHYGCVMYKPPFRAQAEYIYSDYDLYAIISADDPQLNQLMKSTGFGGVTQSQGPHLTNVQYFVKAAGELKGAQVGNVPMIRHGEQETFKTDYSDDLDVFHPDGKTVERLEKGDKVEKFYRETLGGRKQVSDGVVLRQVYGNWWRT